MTVRALHRVVGLVMLLPFVGWAVTGAIFFIKPGYGGAYEPLAVKTYPLGAHLAIDPPASWLEVRYVRTTLGDHVLARTSAGWRQFDAHTLEPRPAPASSDVRALVTDAVTANPARYGRIVSVDGLQVVTDTGARVSLDWNRLSLSQRGVDTDRIDRLYKIHYLQWTGVPALDRVLGGVGLALVLVLSLLGVRLLRR
jgi:hypothetical protein